MEPLVFFDRQEHETLFAVADDGDGLGQRLIGQPLKILEKLGR